VQAAGRNFAADDEFGAAEKISLEIGEPHVASLMKLGAFRVFQPASCISGAETGASSRPFLGRGGPNIDFDDVGKLAQRDARIVGREVIEGDEIASRFQPLAGGDDAVFRLNRFQNLGHRLVGGSSVIRSLNRTSRVQFTKARRLSQSSVDTEKQGSIQGGAGGKFRIGVEVVFHTVAEKNFVSEHTLCDAVKNRLAGNEALPGNASEIGAEVFFGRSGFHLCISAQPRQNFRRNRPPVIFQAVISEQGLANHGLCAHFWIAHFCIE
jgi:hypothetical protein